MRRDAIEELRELHRESLRLRKPSALSGAERTELSPREQRALLTERDAQARAALELLPARIEEVALALDGQVSVSLSREELEVACDELIVLASTWMDLGLHAPAAAAARHAVDLAQTARTTVAEYLDGISDLDLFRAEYPDAPLPGSQEAREARDESLRRAGFTAGSMAHMWPEEPLEQRASGMRTYAVQRADQRLIDAAALWWENALLGESRIERTAMEEVRRLVTEISRITPRFSSRDVARCAWLGSCWLGTAGWRRGRRWRRHARIVQQAFAHDSGWSRTRSRSVDAMIRSARQESGAILVGWHSPGPDSTFRLGADDPGRTMARRIAAERMSA